MFTVVLPRRIFTTLRKMPNTPEQLKQVITEIKYGISGRARLFEVIQRCEKKACTGKTVEYIAAVPRMQLYIDYSARIYNTYLEYVSAEDIHVYSIDEVFIDVTDYLHLYRDEYGDEDGIRVAELDEDKYKRLLWKMTPMERANRAKIFMPFAALKGYEEAL